MVLKLLAKGELRPCTLRTVNLVLELYIFDPVTSFLQLPRPQRQRTRDTICPCSMAHTRAHGERPWRVSVGLGASPPTSTTTRRLLLVS
jgi:hypothetical protein